MSMNLLILRTNIETQTNVEMVVPILDNHELINRWTIDTDDVDNVLKIEAKENLREDDIAHLIYRSGFSCEALED